MLATHYDVDAFVDDVSTGAPKSILTERQDCRTDGAAGVWSAHAFVSRAACHPYDLAVYQLGNAGCHDYMWPYLLRWPGLVVLHDAVLHHARAAALLRRGRLTHYRDEFAYCHPDAPADLAEFGIAGFSGAPYYLWPHRRIAIEAARVAAVHSAPLADILRAEHPAADIRVIRMGVSPVHPAAAPPATDGPVFACFGRVTPEKRIHQILRAFASIITVAPSAKLVLVGEVADYFDVGAAIAAFRLEQRVHVTGYVDDASLPNWIAGADVCLCLRWPSARETSASWLRCLAAGRPTVVTDLLQTVDVPMLDPRTWALVHGRADAESVRAGGTVSDAVAVAIDILDEDHSLGLALERLASDGTLRQRLGQRARAWWEARHMLGHMAGDYVDAIGAALARPVAGPPPEWPPHLRADGRETLVSILRECGAERDGLHLDPLFLDEEEGGSVRSRC